MDKIEIFGGERLCGRITVSGAKNFSLPLLAATLLSEARHQIRNVPRLRDVTTMSRLLEHIGAVVAFEGDRSMEVDTSQVNRYEAPYDLMKTMRASVLVLGPLAARFGRARVSLPGGCAIGARPIDQHLKGLKAMGAEIDLEQGYVLVRVRRLKGATFYLDVPTVTGTENLMMAATLAEGRTVIKNAAREPEVVFLAQALNGAGAKISGMGTSTVEVEGVVALEGLDQTVMPDRIEAGTFLVAGALTRGEVEVVNCIPEHLGALIVKLREVGIEIEEGEGRVTVRGNGREMLPADVMTQSYPGFPTDMQAQMMVLLCLARGTSSIAENVFENRFMHVPELCRMGADIEVQGRNAAIRGVENLTGAPVMATDLRASASLILAGLVAKGKTVVDRAYHIDRGYERIEEKLFQLGANIRRRKE